MTVHINPRGRGLIGVRADGANAGAILAELQKTFETFRAENEKQLADLKKGQQDVVQAEKVDRINADIGELQKALDETNKSLAALKVGGAGGDDDPDKAAHRKAFGQFFRKGVDAGLRDLEIKASLTTQSDPDGGYLVPEEAETAIDRVLGTQSAMRSVARVITIGTSSYKKLVNLAGTGSGWVGEEEERPETSGPELAEIVLNTHELYANPAATQTLLDDSRVNIEQWLAEEVSTEFAEQEGVAFVQGDGVKKPRGILGYDTVANANWAWGKLGFVVTGNGTGFPAPTSSVLPADALMDLYYALKAGYRGNARWMMSDAVMGKVRKFKDADGNYIWAPPSGTAEVATILGKPVESDDNMDALGAGTFPVAFGDFSRAYTIIDRAGIRVLRDPYTKKPYVYFYTTKRVGGGVTNFEALKLLKCSA